MTELFWSVLRITLAVYVGWCVLVFLRQSNYVYYPDRVVGLTPAYFDLAFEDVRLTTRDGEQLAAWYIPAAVGDGAPVLLFCHGNAGDIGDRLDSIRTFHRMGFSVLIFDYRGYGDSTGKPSEEGTYLDAMAAWRYLRDERGIAADRIVVFGRSLGGAVATHLATQVDAAALYIESAFTSAPAMASRVFPFLPSRLLCRFRYDSLAAMSNLQGPVVVAHSPEDTTIPFMHGQKLFAAAPEPKCFIELAGDHNSAAVTADSPGGQRLMAFLREHGLDSLGLGRGTLPDAAKPLNREEGAE